MVAAALCPPRDTLGCIPGTSAGLDRAAASSSLPGPWPGLCDSRAVLHQRWHFSTCRRQLMELLRFSFPQPRDGALLRGTFFLSPITFLAAKENGTCSGSSQNSRELAVSNSRHQPRPGEVFSYIPAPPGPDGQGAVTLLPALPAPVALGEDFLANCSIPWRLGTGRSGGSSARRRDQS